MKIKFNWNCLFLCWSFWYAPKCILGNLCNYNCKQCTPGNMLQKIISLSLTLFSLQNNYNYIILEKCLTISENNYYFYIAYISIRAKITTTTKSYKQNNYIVNNYWCEKRRKWLWRNFRNWTNNIHTFYSVLLYTCMCIYIYIYVYIKTYIKF